PAAQHRRPADPAVRGSRPFPVREEQGLGAEKPPASFAALFWSARAPGFRRPAAPAGSRVRLGGLSLRTPGRPCPGFFDGPGVGLVLHQVSLVVPLAQGDNKTFLVELPLTDEIPLRPPFLPEPDRSDPVGGRSLDPQGSVREPLFGRTVLVAVPVGRQSDHFSVAVVLHRLPGERLPLVHGHVVLEVEVLLVNPDHRSVSPFYRVTSKSGCPGA